ncbi:MAG: alpha-2-macroglobulin family protein [Myxococcales bacterium]
MGVAGAGDAAPADRAARGLDLFVHAPAAVAAGASLAVQVRVFGFATVSTLAPLAGAQLEAAWDPEALGASGVALPPPTKGRADAAGFAHLDVLVPAGSGALKLLLSARSGDHERTREITVTRVPARAIDLRVSDGAVVPGGTVAAWVFVRDVASGHPVGGAPLDVELREGKVRRFSKRLTTDRAGMAATRVPVPFTDDPDWRWALVASVASEGGAAVTASRELRVREETPGAPTLRARWIDASVRPGARASFTLETLDASGAVVAGLPVRYWVGPQGVKAPDDDKGWTRASTTAVTDLDGRFYVTVDTPATIPKRGGALTLLAKAAIDGHPVAASAALVLDAPKPVLEVIPEYGVLMPGLTQRLFVHATFGERPLATKLAIEGHGLAARLETNARGWGEAVWSVPRDVGASVPSGAQSGCAGSVAATVRLRPLAPTGFEAHPQPFAVCVAVDREATATVRPARPIVRAGDAVQVRMIERKTARAGGPSLGVTSVLLADDGGGQAATGWLESMGRGGTLQAPSRGRGLFTLRAAGTTFRPRAHATAVERVKGDAKKDYDDLSESGATDDEDATRGEGGRVLPSSVLVLPRVLPVLTAKRVVGAGANRGNVVEIDADLGDGHGVPLTGSIGAVVIDERGGENPGALLELDTRRALAAAVDVLAEDADAFLEGDGRYDLERWAALARARAGGGETVLDPVASVDARLDQAFQAIVHSLEGAVYESSGDPELLRDVRVATTAGFALNPEMLTLSTDAMSDAPVTPGGEPWRLPDLMAIDRQVNYDNVARRVTRLKLFRVLSAVRAFVYDHRLGPDEPALSDPNALLRRLVRQGTIESGDLLDPWGHGLSFARASGPRVPFLSTLPGYRLRSAGPDGRFGTGDDVGDPFQRVLRSGTPYGRAVHEDDVVDARFDMRVGDETVDGWKATLEKHTGQKLGGDDEATVTGGLGMAGHGSGYGSGYGRGAGALRARSSHGIDIGPAEWLPPARTDARGHLHLSVPLRDTETTWKIVLVAVPDHTSPAVTSVEVPVSLPLSIGVTGGASWIVGDEVSVALAIRNRTDHAVSAAVQVKPSGVVSLADTQGPRRTVAVAARSTASVLVRVRAHAAGAAALDVSVSAQGVPSDSVRHEWQVRPAGEASLAANAVWVEQAATVALPSVADGVVATGPARLVLECGLEPVLAGALESLRPERLTGLRAFADALEVFGRLRSRALVRGGEGDPLAARAAELAELAVARLPEPGHGGTRRDLDKPLAARAALWEAAAVRPTGKDGTRASSGGGAKAPDCPPSGDLSLATRLDWLDVAPPGGVGTERACWAAFRTSALQQLAATSEPLLLARAVNALRDISGQAMLAGALADRLRAAVPVRPDGTVTMPGAAEDRASRSIVMAALVRAAKLGHVDAATSAGAARLATRLLVERDPAGGYGSAQATCIVVGTLLEAFPGDGQTAAVRWAELGPGGREGARGRVDVSLKRPVTIPLSASATGVRVDVSTPGVVARVERPVLRLFLRTPDPGHSPLHVQLEAPNVPRARGTAVLHLGLRHDLGRSAAVMVRLPLPPGASLAEPVTGVRQVQGALYLRTTLDADPLPRVFSIPLRFALAGSVLLPEVTARIDDEEFPPAYASARHFVIQP